VCNFFSFCMDEFGKKYYFDAKGRKTESEPDSHSRICSRFFVREDSVNKFEFNPLTREFTVDNLNTVDNKVQAEDWVKSLNFKRIIPLLIIKPIVNPLKIKAKKVTALEISKLETWNSVWNSVRNSVQNSVQNLVRDSVWNSVRNSVQNLVRNSVYSSVQDSVRSSVWNSVYNSVRDSAGISAWNSVRDSVWDSVYAYLSTFFSIDYKYDFSSINFLWESGFVASFDGTLWRLHTGNNAKIVYTWNTKTNEKTHEKSN